MFARSGPFRVESHLFPTKDVRLPACSASDVSQPHKEEYSFTVACQVSTEMYHDMEDLNPFCQPQTSVVPAFLEVLTYPGAVKRKSLSKDPMPSHLNSSQMIHYLEEQEHKKVEKE